MSAGSFSRDAAQQPWPQPRRRASGAGPSGPGYLRTRSGRPVVTGNASGGPHVARQDPWGYLATGGGECEMVEQTVMGQGALRGTRTEDPSVGVVPALDVVTLETPNLGDRSYLVAVGGLAVAIDPQRDIDRVLAVLTERGWHLAYVFETHVHDDYVTGGLGSPGSPAPSTWCRRWRVSPSRPRRPVTAMSSRPGAARWRAVHTPGHTPHHISYVVSIDGADRAVFTGGSCSSAASGDLTCSGPATRWVSRMTSGTPCAGSARRSRAARRCCRPTGSAPLQRHRDSRHSLDRRPAARGEPGLPAWPGRVRR